MSQRSPAPELSSNRPAQSSPSSQRFPPPADSKPAQDVIRRSPPVGVPLVGTSPPTSKERKLESGVTRESSQARAPISPNTGRSFGVHSILNPAQHETLGGPRQEQERWQSRGGSLPIATPRTASIDTGDNKPPQQLRLSESEGNPAETGRPTNSTRPTLTPRSPNTQTPNLGAFQSRKASLDSSVRPAPDDNQPAREDATLHRINEANPYAAFPSNTGTNRPPIFGSMPEPPSMIHNRRTSGGSGLGFATQSQEPSPSTSHSSYSHSQTSPAPGFGLTPRATPSFPPIGPPAGTPYRQPSSFSTGPPSGLSASGSLFDLAHGSYEMTLDTEHGPLRVPVDVQQASHIADEKRKRNAGASARFRARRKEKEREASQTISSLEKDLREMAEERDFYANERSFFRDLASRHVQVPIRPPSPRHRRLPPPSAMSPGFQTEEGRGEPPARNLRRRTSDYQPTAATAPPIAPVASRAAFPFGPPPTFQMPLPEIRPAAGREGPSPSSSLPPRVERYDPLRQGSYERSWNPAR